jgi:NADH-quinone oxidoreductase subunit H
MRIYRGGVLFMSNLHNLISILEVIIVVLIGVAYITLAERKVMGSMQRRVGPNIIGYFGILQPVIDGVKAAIKETIIPQQSNRFYFLIGPIIVLTLCLIIWAPIPFKLGEQIDENNYGILYILAISSLSVYILLYSGWSSNSKYAFLGSLRSIAQLISYEVSIGIIIMSVLVFSTYGSFNLNYFILQQIFIPNLFPLFPIFILFFISILAETNRPPFDLPEAESELIAGYIVEYGGMAFAAIYLAEYGFIQAMCSFASLLFWGAPGTLSGTLFTVFLIFAFIWVRSSLPRIRYDQLMGLGWTKILPFSISYLVFLSSLLATLL